MQAMVRWIFSCVISPKGSTKREFARPPHVCYKPEGKYYVLPCLVVASKSREKVNWDKSGALTTISCKARTACFRLASHFFKVKLLLFRITNALLNSR